MPKVTGPLKTVLSSPSQVTGAWIRSGEDRPDGDGMILNELDKVPITGGVVSFTAACLRGWWINDGSGEEEIVEEIP